MEILYERCAGLDVHKKNVKVCVITPGGHHQPNKEIRTYPTTTHGLLQMRDWLHAQGCTHLAMESTGVYTPPPMLPIGGDILRRRRKRGRTDAKDDADLLSIHLNPFDQGTDDRSARLKICLLQPILYSGSKRF